MLEGPAREKPWVSWLCVVTWSLLVFITIPFVRGIQKFVGQHWGREVFTYVVLVTIVIALATVARHVIRHRPSSPARYFWLLAVAAVFLGYTINLSQSNPEEAIHFIQYGLLGILVFRALTHHLSDLSIYYSAAIVCGMIGAMDEFIQWITPDRIWDLRDIWINFLAASLVQVAIAKGLKPEYLANRHDRTNLRFLCRISIGAALLFWICLLNTPSRIAWYSERIPGLAFLKHNDSVMLEYGYLYNDGDTGIFRSRFSIEELRRHDRERAKEVAGILDSYQGKSRYLEFLRKYTPVNDPFVHEARVHLASRDHHFMKATETQENLYWYTRHLNIAYRENQIMDKYFTNTLKNSSYVWSAEQFDLAKKFLLKDWTRKSWVSRGLVTAVKEAQVNIFFALLIAGLVILHWHLGRHLTSD